MVRRNLDKLKSMGIIEIYVHLWDAGGISGIKVAYWRRNTEPPYDWPETEPKIFFTKDYSKLYDDASVAYLQGKAAKEFLAQRGYKINQKNKLPVKIQS